MVVFTCCIFDNRMTGEGGELVQNIPSGKINNSCVYTLFYYIRLKTLFSLSKGKEKKDSL